MNICLIICTKDRPKDLTTLLNSVKNQTRLPNRVLIIDGSDDPIKHVLENFKDLPLEYSAVRPPSLPKQRNVGIGLAGDTGAWLGFLDDDLVLVDNALEKLEHFVDTNLESKESMLGGVGLVINNEGLMKYSRWREFCLLDKLPGGIFTSSGCPAAIRPVNKDQDVEWLYGGATFWKSDIFKEFSYDEWFSGTGYYEDIDFSYRVGQKYRLALSAESRCFHYSHPVRKERLIALGTWQLTGWWYFISKVKTFKKRYVFWSMFGLTLNNLGVGLISFNTGRIRKAIGNIKGWFLILSGKALLKKGFSK
jgi:glycosyltransferase involved in cell wall biosynthesis